MQPTVRPASSAFAHGATQPHQHQQHPQQFAAGGTAARGLQRQQWEARLASFQRGLDHVMRCNAGDACGSSLCHATKRLMRSYATHDCTNPPGTTTTTTTSTNPNECKVCKLWGYILAKHKSKTDGAGPRTASSSSSAAPSRWHSPTLSPLSSPVLSSSSSSTPPVLPPLSCGLAHARATGGAVIGGIGGIGGIDRFARDARGGNGFRTTQPPRRRVIVTPELVKAMAKRV